MKVRTTLVTVALGLGMLAHADGKRVELPQLFSSKAAVTIDATGLQRLELPVEVLEKCRPGLSDVRLWQNGAEAPYLVDSTGAVAWTLAETAPLKVDKVAHDRQSPLCDPAPRSGHCETMEGPTQAKGDGWELVFELDGDRFVDSVGITMNGKVVKHDSIFRLPGGPTERLRIPLPAVPAGVRLGVVLKGDGAALSPKLHLERGRGVRGGEQMESSLVVSARWHDRAGSHILLDRPPGFLPTALRFTVATAAFDRAVTVYDYTGADLHKLVGEGRLSRVSIAAGGDSVAIDQLDVPLAVPRMRKLEVVIDDGDSPPLDPTIRAVLSRPTLVFMGTAQAPTTLFFGGGRAEVPRYDLQALLPPTDMLQGVDGVRAEVAARLHAREGLLVAKLGPSMSNALFDPTPALQSVAHAGSAIGLGTYSHERTLELAPSPDGLSRYVLQAADLAAARPDLADVRIVDTEGRQWPYLVDPTVDAAVVELAAPTHTSDKGVTRYELPLPSSPLAPSELVLDIKESFFDRAARIITKDEAGRERTLDNMHIHRSLSSGPDGEVVLLRLDHAQVSSLAIEITDGGDAPLTLAGARVRVPTSALLLASTAGHYRLLVGDPAAEAPTYEIRSLADLVAQLEATDAKVGPLQANPAFSRGARLSSGGARDRLLVWVVLGLAVLILGGLTLRLARTPEEPQA